MKEACFVDKARWFSLGQYPLPHHCISRWVGRLADTRTPWLKNAFIRWFVKRYQVDMSEALESNPIAYDCFNDFFTRALRPDVREIDPAADVVSPADGAISQCGAIEAGRIFQAKGHDYSLNTLLGGDLARAKPFMGGQFATIYLSPRDYHRVHMPVTGTLREAVYIPGRLFSVNQATAAHVPDLFARNERLVAIFDTQFGPMAMVLVGAMIVAGIDTVWQGQVTPQMRQITSLPVPEGPVELEKGAEMGRFKLGSTVIVLMANSATQWHESLGPQSSVRMGQELAQVSD